MNKIDQRTLKTKAKIETAIIELCQKQTDFDHLTAPKLAATAGISRQTFYRYYLSPQQVITTMIDQHLTEFLKEFRLQNLTARSMTLQLMTIWQSRTMVFKLVEWSNTRQEFIQRLAAFNQRIAQQNKVNLVDEVSICNVYAAATYMLLRDYVLKQKWTTEQATDLLLHLTNNMDKLF
ncbi:TetR/AcrR family transcriptional regulator [Loigolactobacillus zhaoyuanensis]|uniref:TetR/AcrR family transcriptional regulator n=1 Tax=Loigolactobacillus zhaoyuanensis TaxID=2486017 RepID=A0ABW8U8R6_9LACO